MSTSDSRHKPVYQPNKYDRMIILATQSGLPLTERPYHTIAEQIGLTEDEVMVRMKRMQNHGVIRRIAAVPNHYALGYTHNGMTVWDVTDEKISQLGKAVSEFEFVSHCYHRPRHLPLWPYNLFAMVHGKTKDDADQQIALIKQTLGDDCRAHEVLFSKRILKKTGIRLKS